VVFVEGVVLLFVSIGFVVCALGGRGGGDTREGGGGGDRGKGILLLSVNCTGNTRVIGTGVGRDIDSVVTGGVVVVIIVTVDVEKLVHYDWV